MITTMTADADRMEQPYFARLQALDAYRPLVPRGESRSGLVAAHSVRNRRDLGLTVPNVRSDTLVAVVYLRDVHEENEVWCDGRPTQPRAARLRGGLAVLDLRQAWHSQVRAPFETLHVSIPMRSLDELTDEMHVRRLETLSCPHWASRHDPVMLHLALSLLPAFRAPGQASAMFTDHVFAAMRLHLAQTYGGVQERDRREYGGLAPWQARRAMDLMQDQLDGDLTLAEVAAACGMSVRHFARAFKSTTGAPPHRWLLEKRVQRAKELLACTHDPVSDIALTCGFADQSHLSRVFRNATGTSPAAWRRQQRH